MNKYRTHNCNELRSSHIGQRVTLSGWVNSARDHKGVIFIDLRDREGITQIVFRQEISKSVAEMSHSLHSEDVIQITGEVAQRLIDEDVDTTNKNLATGDIEIVVDGLKVLSKSDILPFQVANVKDVAGEEIRSVYKYLDIRRSQIKKNLIIRHKLAHIARSYFFEKQFIEVETPILTKSTPEGARDFLVPSRLNPGKFYALPQAPQQYKQLLMVGGIERYFQIAKCFRDEDLRADRQPEFTQLDLEMSFVSLEEIIELISNFIIKCYKDILDVDLPDKFPIYDYDEAMNRWGSDKPDLSFDMELNNVSEVFEKTQFKVFENVIKSSGSILAINAKGFASVSTGQIKSLTDSAIEAGAKGLAFIKVGSDGTWKSPIVKFFSEEEIEALKKKLSIEEGDLILFSAGEHREACEILGKIRLDVEKYLNLKKDGVFPLWVTHFPLFEYNDDENRWTSVHHPFTRPIDENIEYLHKQDNFEKVDFKNIKSESYDLVINGSEIGGGSVRIHERELQEKMFDILGISEEEQQNQFGHLLRAFSYGVPPHGGIALGFDRLCMILCGEKSIRDVIAFPKNNKGVDLMINAPDSVDHKQLREYYVKSTYDPKRTED